MDADPVRLSEAVVIWTGWGKRSWPQRDESLLVEALGADATAELMPLVRQLEDDFYASDAASTAASLTGKGRRQSCR